MVLVPGLGLDARAWAAVSARLAAPSLVVPLPSMGRPAPPGTDLHVEQQCRRLAAALPGVGDLVLVGHSASCPVVVAVAACVPRVVGLVLIGPVTDPQARSWPRVVARLLRTAAHEPLWLLPLLVPQYRSTGPGSMVRGMSHVRRYRTRVALSALSVPTHVIRGEHDHIASASWCSRLVSAAPTEQITAPGAGHMVTLTHPSVIAASADRLALGFARGAA